MFDYILESSKKLCYINMRKIVLCVLFSDLCHLQKSGVDNTDINNFCVLMHDK